MSKTFESSLSELEAIVKQLEDGDLPLEETMKLFEAGVALSKECHDRLAQAEKRIEALLREPDGSIALHEIPTGD